MEKNGGGGGSSLKSIETPLKVPIVPTTQYSGNSTAVISTESVHINLDRGNLNRSISSHDATAVDLTDATTNMRTVDLRDAPNGRTSANPNTCLLYTSKQLIYSKVYRCTNKK